MFVLLFVLLFGLWVTPAEALLCPNKPSNATTLATVSFNTTDGEGQMWDLYPGAGAILRLVPTANGSTMQWTAGTGSSNYLEVDDVPFAEASYVKNVSANDVALFALTDTGAAGITGTINAVRPLIYPRLDSTGTNALSFRLKSGATTDTLSSVATTTGGIYLSKVYATDPNTGSAWTLAGVDALEVGAIETSAILSRLMDVHVYVDYTPATGGCRMMLCGVGR